MLPHENSSKLFHVIVVMGSALTASCTGDATLSDAGTGAADVSDAASGSHVDAPATVTDAGTPHMPWW